MPIPPLPSSSSVTGRGWILLACSISRVRLPTGSLWFCERERMLSTKGTKLPGPEKAMRKDQREGKKRRE